jgi:hypothetical protein
LFQSFGDALKRVAMDIEKELDRLKTFLFGERGLAYQANIEHIVVSSIGFKWVKL